MYNTQDITSRIKLQLKTQHLIMKNMLADLEMGINAISEFSKGKQMSCISLAKIADYLNCSVDYLLGRTDTPEVNRHTDINRLPQVEINSSSASFVSGYVEHELLLIEKYRRLSSSGQQKLHDRADELQVLGFTQEKESKNATPQKMA